MYLEPKENSGVNDIQKVILGFFDLYVSEQSAQLKDMGLTTTHRPLKSNDKTAKFYLGFIKQNFDLWLNFEIVPPYCGNYSMALYRLEREFKNGYNDDLFKFVQAIRIASES